MRLGLPSRHPLADAVATIFPGPSDTQLLRGTLVATDAGRRALSEWLAAQPDAVAALTAPSRRWLLPLVLRACNHHRLLPGRAVATVLRTATLREQLRTTSYQAIRRRVLRSLAAAGVEPLVLKGAALGELVYPEPALRHAHDLELLVRDADWAKLADALAHAEVTGLEAITGGVRVELTHASGLPLVLHRHLFRIPFHNAYGGDVWLRSEARQLAGTPACVLGPADALVHACGDAPNAAACRSWRWLVDAWFLLERRPDLDWHAVVAIASARGMALPMALALDYLSRELAAPVPDRARERMASLASGDRSLGPELALHGARAAAGGLRPLLQRTGSPRGRVAVIWHVLTPSLAFLGWATQPRGPVLRAAHAQAFRVAHFVARQGKGNASTL